MQENMLLIVGNSMRKQPQTLLVWSVKVQTFLYKDVNLSII